MARPGAGELPDPLPGRTNSSVTLSRPRRVQVAARLGVSLPPPWDRPGPPWYAVVASRWGRDLLAHHADLATLYRWIGAAVGQGEWPICIPGTAAHWWVRRACQLQGLPWVEIDTPDARSAAACPDADDPPGMVRLQLGAAGCSPDALLLALADRIDVAAARRGGTIHRELLRQLAQRPGGQLRVRVPVEPWGEPGRPGTDRLVEELIAAGAVGYCCRWNRRRDVRGAVDQARRAAAPPMADAALQRSLVQAPGRWLVHCTRGRAGPWPGESERQFRDWLLITPPTDEVGAPLETLVRIVRQRRLVGSGSVTQQSTPLVCFSALPLLDATARRTYRPHLGRWDNEPYGVVIDRQAAGRLGAMPVIYFRGAVPADVPGDQRWRLQAMGQTYDWTQEQEWRFAGVLDLTPLGDHQAVWFVDRDEEIARLPPSPWPAVSIESLRNGLNAPSPRQGRMR